MTGRRALLAIGLAMALAGSAVAVADPVPLPCDSPYGDCLGRVVVGAGDGGFDAGLYYAAPGGSTRQVRGTGQECEGCAWQLTPACDGNRPALPGERERGEVNCARAASSCPGGMLDQVWLKRPGAPWLQVDTICLRIGSRVSNLRDLAPDVATAFRRLPLPAPELRRQPAGDAVIRIPVVFYVLAEPARTVDLQVDGFAVELTAAPSSWQWRFGDGSPPLTTAEPGRPYPEATVTHEYARPGAMTATVSCVWRASYVVAGTALRIAVADPVALAGSAVVRLREARAELVGG